MEFAPGLIEIVSGSEENQGRMFFNVRMLPYVKTKVVGVLSGGGDGVRFYMCLSHLRSIRGRSQKRNLNFLIAKSTFKINFISYLDQWYVSLNFELFQQIPLARAFMFLFI